VFSTARKNSNPRSRALWGFGLKAWVLGVRGSKVEGLARVEGLGLRERGARHLGEQDAAEDPHGVGGEGRGVAHRLFEDGECVPDVVRCLLEPPELFEALVETRVCQQHARYALATR